MDEIMVKGLSALLMMSHYVCLSQENYTKCVEWLEEISGLMQPGTKEEGLIIARDIVDEWSRIYDEMLARLHN